ncbi:MAG: GNAT family N-acetyltransferase [Actinomycetales bacterium]|nr:GNAT family N-acetyltransferase [Actinomycetales bacterium]
MPAPDVVIRQAGAADLPILLTLTAEYAAAAGAPRDTTVIRRALRPLLDDRPAPGIVLLCQSAGPAGTALGYAVLTWGWSLESGGREALLDEVFIRQPGQGHGSALIAAVLECARTGDVGAVFLETEERNPRARSFYARHGFAVENSIWMRRPVAPATGGTGN